MQGSDPIRHQRRRRPGLVCTLVLVASSCAGADTTAEDPYEGFNRRVFAFNEAVDDYVHAPLAWVWDALFPAPVQRALVRVFANLGTPLNVVHHALTAEWGASGGELSRFVVNSTVGLAGLFDPAEGWGLAPRPTDFGATLAAWGMPPGPYLVLPFLGPATARSALGLGGDIPLRTELYHGYGLRVTPVAAVELVNARARRDVDIDIARETSLDYYVFRRSHYLQRRGVVRIDYSDDSAEPQEDSDG